jgi:hypothetical protein
MTQTSNQHIYLRFLGHIHAIEEKGELPSLELDAKRLLELIAVRHFEGRTLTVSDAMSMSSIASPATIHRKLDVLRESGMIYSAYEAGNRRTKFLRPTDQAYDYFNTLGSFIGQASVMKN